jgi:hypothetical protein
MSEHMNERDQQAEIERALYWIDEGTRAADALARQLRMARSMTEKLGDKPLSENGVKNVDVLGSAMRVVAEHLERGETGFRMFFKNSE